MTIATDATPCASSWTLGREHPNHFDFLRFAFAVLVIYCHCFLSQSNLLSLERNLIDLLTREQYNSGWLAVNAFFVLSGFLGLHSWLSSGDFWQYFRKRVVTPVFWSVGPLTVRMTHDLIVALLHSACG